MTTNKMNEKLLSGATTPAVEWPLLIPLDTPDLPLLDLKLLPGWAGAFAESLSKSTETPPELAAGMVLSAAQRHLQDDYG